MSKIETLYQLKPLILDELKQLKERALKGEVEFNYGE